MARPSQIWFRKEKNKWFVTIGGKQIALAKGKENKKAAQQKFHDLMSGMARAPEGSTARTADIVEAFLKHSRIHFAPDTHRLNRYYCQLFAEACGTILASEIKPFNVARWIDPKVEAKEWGETTVYNARRAAFRVFSWAAQQKILAANPLHGMPRPKPAPRQRAITDQEFWALYQYAGGPLRDLLLALYLTGARPKEVRELKWEQVEENRWVLGKHKTKKKTGKTRVIILDQTMQAMMERLKGRGDYVFYNTVGEPWTMNALRLQISRLKKKLNLSKDICAYLCRHGFGTRAVLNGVEGKTLAELMGHSSLDMINTVYVHLADEHKHLAAAVERINGPMPLPADQDSTRKRARPVQKEDEKKAS